MKGRAVWQNFNNTYPEIYKIGTKNYLLTDWKEEI